MTHAVRALFCSLLLLTACGGYDYVPPTPELQPIKTEIMSYDPGGMIEQIVIRLSYRTDKPVPQTCIIAVHGAGYNARYWDAADASGLSPGKSMIHALTAAGYAVAAVNLPGTAVNPRGLSPDTLTLPINAGAVHGIALMLKGRYGRLVFLGHSAGAAISLYAQAQHSDAIAVIVQGFSITPHMPPVPPDVIAGLLSNEYAEYPPDLRTAFFLSRPPMDGTINADTMAADRVPRGLLIDMLTAFGNPGMVQADKVRAPIYVQQSTGDLLYPPAAWPGAAQVSTYQTIGHAFEMAVPIYADPVRNDVLSALTRMIGGAQVR